jgi:anthranilate synthase component 1
MIPPLALYRALCDDGRRPHTLLLESADPESGAPGRSTVVLSTALSVSCEGEVVTVVALNRNGGALLPALAARLGADTTSAASGRITHRVPRAPALRVEHERLRARGTLDVVRTLLRLLQPGVAGLPESVLLPGLISYDLAGQFEGLPSPGGGGPEVPDFQFYLADRVVIVDHPRRRSEIIALVLNESAGEAEAAREDIATIMEWASREPAEAPPPGAGVAASVAAEPVADLDDEAFAALVNRLKTNIVAGDVFQVVPSRTFSVPCPDPLAAYEVLRQREPVPYQFYVNAGDSILFGASPESALRVNGPAGTIEVSPIAGTRPRGRTCDGRLDPELDARLEAELRLDAKEQAEHLMLVDLARNDVARVSRPGTRRVTELMRIRRYGRVMHLVSRVEGTLAAGLDALHACQAVLPMGTLTGAPKHRAMELLRGVEAGHRGLYGGAVCCLTGDGSLDAAIIIRSASVRDGMARVRAGAGVVHDSVPLREAEETRRKADAVLGAIAAASTGRRVSTADAR